jgi:hypothetical protein
MRLYKIETLCKLITICLLGLTLFGIANCYLYASTSKRVLVVTVEPDRLPKISSAYDGEYVITDLTAAGYPFDVVTYSRFINMPLTGYDIIILNGHTSPVPVSQVRDKCQAALQEGRKVFVNGENCFRRYDDQGTLVEFLRYTLNLFNATIGWSGFVSGNFSISASIEKDPALTALNWTNFWVNEYRFTNQPEVYIKIGGRTIGFLYPNGGALDTSGASAMHMLDYGKVVSYLRYGRPEIIGFANDRIEGRPIVSFEVHCDSSSDVAAINQLLNLATDYNLPLVNLIVYNRLTSSSIAKWNEVSANPLMRIGSHSRSHPMNWPTVSDIAYETTGAITAQRQIIPATEDIFNWSGSMNPTIEQFMHVANAGILMGGGGFDERRITLPDGSFLRVQRMPTRQLWFQLMARIEAPFLLSQTLNSDYNCWNKGLNYLDEIRTDFQSNLKYGMYSYGYIHDYMFSPTSNYYTNGIRVSTLIRNAIDYLSSKSAKFIPVDELILRLRDFITGRIDYQVEQDNSLTVTLYRPLGKANQVKIRSRDGKQAIASGDSVISQHLAGAFTYVDLRPETTSVFRVDFTPTVPQAPIVTASEYAYNNIDASWTMPADVWTITNYQYALGTSPGADDIVSWTSVGTAQSCRITNINLEPSKTYYISVKATSNYGLTSPAGISNPIHFVYSGNIAEARRQNNGTRVIIEEAAVTAVFPDCAYIEQLDRISGIKVVGLENLYVGKRVSVNGIIAFRDGERLIENATATSATPNVYIKPLAMPNKSVGGNGLDSLNPGIDNGTGLFNVGLLITTSGKVTYTDSNFFYIDDGSNLDDGSGYIGLRVDARSLNNIPSVGSYVSVTGISTVQMIGERVIRVVRPRNQQDVLLR